MGTAQVALAFTTAAAVMVVLLIVGSVVVSSVSAAALKPVRMAGPAVRRWSGFVLMMVGVWFVVLATLPDPVLGS